jgi:hypothetical protein
MMTESSPKSAWREPMVWLIVGLPLAAIIASVSLVVKTAHMGDSEEISGNDASVSQARADPAAHPSGLLAVIRISEGMVEVVSASDGFDHTVPLRVIFEDKQGVRTDMQLQPAAHGWRAETHIDVAQDWRVQLLPEDGSWRLFGSLPRWQQSTRLMPVPGNKTE